MKNLHAAKKRYLISSSLLSCFIAVSISTGCCAFAASDNEKPAKWLTVEHISSISDQRERDIVIGLKQARKVYGPFHKVSFERLMQLAELYIAANRMDALTDMGDELRNCFPQLSTSDKQYFGVQMLNKAFTLVRSQQYIAGETLYLPVVQSSEVATWGNGAELASDMVSLGELLQDRRRLAEAQTVLSAANTILQKLPESSPRHWRALRSLASINVRLKSYDQAIANYEVLMNGIDVPQQQVWSQSINGLVSSLRNDGDQNRMKILATKLIPACAALKKAEHITAAAACVNEYIEAGLFGEASNLYNALLEAFSKCEERSAVHLLHAVDRAANAFVTAGRPDAASQVYQSWLQTVRKKYGADTLEATLAAQAQEKFLQSQRLAAQREKELADPDAEPDVGSIKYRIERVRLLQRMDRRQPQTVLNWLNPLLKDVPSTADGARLYIEAARTYRWLGVDSEEQNAKALTIMTKLLPAQNSYLTPYILQLAQTSDRTARTVEDFTREFLSAIDRPPDARWRSLDDLVSQYLRAQGKRTAALELRSVQLQKLVAQRRDPHQLQQCMKNYVRELTEASGGKFDENSEPNMEFVKQAYQVAIESALLSVWAKLQPSPSAATLVAQFYVGKSGIENVSITQPKPVSATQSAEVTRCFESIKDLNDGLPGFIGMEFKAWFSTKPRTVKVAAVAAPMGASATGTHRK